MAQQINVFVENRPGRLNSITEALKKSGINIIAFAIQDRGDFGVMKLLVNKPDEAQMALSEKGFAAALKDILVVAIKDKPGNLNKLTALFLKHNINIIDAHGFVGPENTGICCVELVNSPKPELKKLLQKNGFKVLSKEEVYEL